MEEEQWKFLSWTLKYSVSNLGRVRNDETGQILYIEVTERDQHKVHLNIMGKKRKLFISRLVAEAFIPNPDNLPDVCRIDNTKSDYSAKNLEWGRRGSRPKNRTYDHDKRVPTSTPGEYTLGRRVRCLDSGVIYDSVPKAAEAVDGDRNGIWRVCTGRQTTYRGLRFEFVEDGG